VDLLSSFRGCFIICEVTSGSSPVAGLTNAIVEVSFLGILQFFWYKHLIFSKDIVPKLTHNLKREPVQARMSRRRSSDQIGTLKELEAQVKNLEVHCMTRESRGARHGKRLGSNDRDDRSYKPLGTSNAVTAASSIVNISLFLPYSSTRHPCGNGLS